MKNYYLLLIIFYFFIFVGANSILCQKSIPQSKGSESTKTQFPYKIDLQDADNQKINSSKLFKNLKTPIVLVFWLTTCGPCKMELTAITKKYAQWQKEKKFKLYAISTDFQERTPQFISRVKESQWPFQAFHDINREFSTVMPGELNGLPQVFVLDRKGNIKYHHRKYSTGDEDILFEEIKKVK
ncbi:MAG: TlpA disulfide reductase family protein [Saprospiraceae bacterium]